MPEYGEEAIFKTGFQFERKSHRVALQPQVDVFNTSLLTEITSLIAEGTLGNFSPDPNQEVSSKLGCSRKLLVRHPSMPGKRVSIGGIGVVKQERDSTVTISDFEYNTPIPLSSLTINFWGDVVPVRMGRVPLGGYAQAELRNKLAQTQYAREVLEACPSVELPEIITTGNYLGVPEYVGFFVSSFPDGIRPKDLLSNSGKIKEVFELAEQFGHVVRTTHELGAAHFQLHLGNWYKSLMSGKIILSDWESVKFRRELNEIGWANARRLSLRNALIPLLEGINSKYLTEEVKEQNRRGACFNFLRAYCQTSLEMSHFKSATQDVHFIIDRLDTIMERIRVFEN